MNTLKWLSAVASLTICTAAQAVILVQTNNPGFYNNSIGTVLNGTNGGESGPFPVSNDAALTFPTAPDLSAASAALGNWLTDPANLNSNWSAMASIPNSWTPNTEVAVIYQFDTLGATNVVASFGVDNGIFVWLNGSYLFGARGPGAATVGEYNITLGDLPAGTHYLQLLLEDHGSVNGYNVLITADTFIPGTVPEPAALALLGIGLAGIAYRQRRQRQSA